MAEPSVMLRDSMALEKLRQWALDACGGFTGCCPVLATNGIKWWIQFEHTGDTCLCAEIDGPWTEAFDPAPTIHAAVEVAADRVAEIVLELRRIAFAQGYDTRNRCRCPSINLPVSWRGDAEALR